MTNIERQIIIGSIIGDGCITTRGALQMEHGPKQAQYIARKAAILRIPVHKYTRTLHGAPYTISRAYTPVSNEYKDMYQDIYEDGKKRYIPGTMISDLDIYGLTIIYIDDGSINKDIITICTDRWDSVSVALLAEKYARVFDVTPKIRRGRITFSTSDSRHIILCMAHHASIIVTDDVKYKFKIKKQVA